MTTAGFRLADKGMDEKTQQSLERGIARRQNELDRLHWERILRARDINPDEVDQKNKLKPGKKSDMTKTANDIADFFKGTVRGVTKSFEGQDGGPGMADWVKAMVLLAGGLSAYTAYNVADDWFADQDPNKQYVKNLKKYFEDKMRVKASPQIVSGIDPSLLAAVRSKSSTRGRLSPVIAPQNRTDELLPERSTTTVDTRDPIASKLLSA
jgi:hypothetical protein